MNIKFAFLLLISVATHNNLSANNKKSKYNEFENDYSSLFGEKPGSVWHSNKLLCGGCGSDCSGQDCDSGCSTSQCSCGPA